MPGPRLYRKSPLPYRGGPDMSGPYRAIICNALRNPAQGVAFSPAIRYNYLV